MERQVLIMLSTYNGQKYIREQLDSLYNQKGVDIHILVRDDGSNDNTIEILKEYERNFGKMTIHADNNCGAALSYYTLMLYAYKDFPQYEYYAFCDQDDYWLSNKLYEAVHQLQKQHASLYYSNAVVTDSELNKIKMWGVNNKLSIEYVMFRQPALGCTQVMNNSFFSYCTEVFNEYIQYCPQIQMHDAWTMWLSQLVGVPVAIDSNAYIYYRQHDSNVTTHHAESIIDRVKRVYKRLRRDKGITYSNMMILRNVLDRQLTTTSIEALNRMENYKNSIWSTISYAFHMQRYFVGVKDKSVVFYRILSRQY